jgi:hypothetical protein
MKTRVYEKNSSRQSFFLLVDCRTLQVDNRLLHVELRILHSLQYNMSSSFGGEVSHFLHAEQSSDVNGVESHFVEVKRFQHRRFVCRRVKCQMATRRNYTRWSPACHSVVAFYKFRLYSRQRHHLFSKSPDFVVSIVLRYPVMFK